MLRFFIAAVAVAAFLSVPVYYLRMHSAAAVFQATTTPATAGPSFTYHNASSDDIYVTAPKAGGTVTTTVIVTGYARGSWFFEASFPVEIRNKNGIIIGTAHAEAQSGWMTDAFVPFTAEVDLKAPYNGIATVMLKNDNPSGDPARDASISFPVSIE